MNKNLFIAFSVLTVFSVGCATTPYSYGPSYASLDCFNIEADCCDEADCDEVAGAVDLAEGDSTSVNSKYFIWSGVISLEHKDKAICEESVIKAVQSYSGKIKSKSGNNYRIELVFLVPANNFEKCMASIKECGDVTYNSVYSKDVTAEYVDTKSRLDNLIKTRDKYKNLLEKAQTVEEILKVEKELARVQSEIDAKTAVFNALKNDVSQYEIRVSIHRKEVKGPLGYLFSGIGYIAKKLFIWN